MKCKKCGNDLSENAIFCGKCGTKVEQQPKPAEKRCSKCGATVLENELFCSSCGTNTSESKGFPGGNNHGSNPSQNKTLITPTPAPAHVNVHPYQKQTGAGASQPNQQNQPPQQTYAPNKQQPYTPSSIGINIPTSFWILGLRVAAYIGLAAVVIVGIIQWAAMSEFNEGGLGFLIFILCVIVGFLTVATLMVFLDMASDIRKIRKKMEER